MGAAPRHGQLESAGGGTVYGSTAAVMGGRTARLHAYEIGGELARAIWPDGGCSWSAPLGTLKLHAVTRRGEAAAGTVVQLLDTDYQATADSAGTLEITDLLPGPYTASIMDERLSALGVPLSTPLRFVAVRDSTVDARLEIETAEDFVAKRCDHDRPISGVAWLLGKIVTPDGRPVEGARWTIRDRYGSTLVEGGRVGGDGLFHWCQLALGTAVEIGVWRDERRVKVSRVLADHLTIVRVEMEAP
jgi:hypothetical protein